MEYAIYGVDVGGSTYYPRPIYDATVSVSSNIYIDTVYPDLSFDNNLSFIIRFTEDYKGRLESDYNLMISDYMSIIVNHNGVPLKYIDVKAGDCFELVNYNGHSWSLLSLDTECMDITYKDLKWLRDNSYLIPGMKYRIIDYVTMDEYCHPDAGGVIRDVSLPFHYSVKHPFDIIVTAETKKTLSPIASAAHSSHFSVNYVDNYFEDCDLSKWKLWYSLDCTDFDFGYDWGIEPGEYIKPIDGIDSTFYGYNFTDTCIPGQMSTTATTRVYITPSSTNPNCLLCYAPYLHPHKVFQVGINLYSGITNVSDITALFTDNLGVTYYKVTMKSGKTYNNLRPISVNLMSAENNIQESLVFYETTLASLILVNISEKTIKATLSNSDVTYVNPDYARLTKGVIYRMIDEWGNDAPYDFKNILSYTPGFNYTSFLFGEKGGYDNSLDGTSSNNTIHPSISDTKQRLPYIHLGQAGAENCTVGKNCYNIFILPPCHNVTIGNNASTIISGDDMGLSIYEVSIGDGCNGIRLEAEGLDIKNVTIGNQCNRIDILTSTEGLANIHIGNNCYNIEGNSDMINSTIGNNCHDITCGSYSIIGDYCYNIDCDNGNTIGNNCHDITCGLSNTFGNNCYSITCGLNNTFGNFCRVIFMTNTGNSNTFGQNCSYIYSGAYSSFNVFGNYVGYIVFARARSSSTTETNRRGYCQYNVLHDGVRYVVIYSTTTASNSAILRNVHIDTPATYLRSSYKYTGASSTTGVAINTSAIQRYKFTASDTTYTLS